MMDDAKPPTLAMMDRLFSREASFTRFALKTFLLTGVGLLPFLVLYVSLKPGFWHSLTSDNVARAYLLRQIVTNGLPVVFLINYVGFTLYAGLARSGTTDRGPARALAIDLPTRLILFFVAHAAIYAGSARLFGSFGGDAMQALVAVGPTIALSSSFGNLSGVYLYATAISAYPLFLAAMLEAIKAVPHSRRYPRLHPSSRWTVPALSALFVMFYLLFAFVISGLALLL